MNFNPSTPRILLYGDSLVYGKVSGENGRLSAAERFTGVLQQLFGASAEVIEEGLRGRMLVGENKFFPERDGLAQFGPIIGSHLGFDILVIFLGTNDCNAGGEVSEERFMSAYGQYIQKVKDWAQFLNTSVPKILLVAPPAIDEAHFDEAARHIFGVGAGERASRLPQIVKSCADALDLEYFDSSTVCEPASGDGIHLSATGNEALAKNLYTKLSAMLG